MRSKHIAFIIAFLLPITIMAAQLFLKPPAEFSDNENRPLAKLPPLVKADVLSGDFNRNFESFIKDQAPLRETGISLATFVRKKLGKSEINDVYLGKDGYLFKKFTDENYTADYMQTIFSIMQEFAQKLDVPARFLLIPDASVVYSEKLPFYAPHYHADTVYKKAYEVFGDALIDPREILAAHKNTSQLYYRTDHHYTTFGAYLAYRAFCGKTQLVPRSEEAFNIAKIAPDFYGTLYSKVLDTSVVPDAIYLAKNLPPVEVTFDGAKKTNSPYVLENLAKKDKYTVFFGGNYGAVEIKTPNKNGKSLLVVKDSFANCFVPFLLNDYESITMIDMRYATQKSWEIVQKNKVNELLFVYEATDILTEKHVSDLVKYH